METTNAINVPVLSTKERLRLQPLLPYTNSGKNLGKRLGYHIGYNREKTKELLRHYAKFHRQVPRFIRGVP